MQTLSTFLNTAKSILNAVIPLLVSLGVVYFVWGIVTYVIAGGEEAKKQGRDRIIYGIIGLAVIVSLWGLVNILINTFSLGGAAPTVASSGACGAGGMWSSFASLVNYVVCILGSAVVPFMFAVAVVVFVWGVIKFFIVDADEEAKRSQGKQFMIWGLVSLTVMISVWGLVQILGNTFGIDVIHLPYTKVH